MKLQCPACKGNGVVVIEDDLLCMTCGNRENLYDFPISYYERESTPIEETRIVHINQPSINVLRELKRIDTDLQEHYKTHYDKKRGGGKYLYK